MYGVFDAPDFDGMICAAATDLHPKHQNHERRVNAPRPKYELLAVTKARLIRLQFARIEQGVGHRCTAVNLQVEN
jgi:hypothetical protein